ncbi:MAG: hypothetical protein AABW59_00285 [archaeon]
MQIAPEVKKIFLIVHPLHSQISGQIPKSKTGKEITKNEMHNYGLAILRAQKDPASLLILVKQPMPPKSDYAKPYARLFDFAKKTLGERMIALEENFGYANLQKYFLDKEMYSARNFLSTKRFNPKVQIEATGQLREDCVEVAVIRLKLALAEKGVKANSKIMKDCKPTLEIYKQYKEAEKGKLTKYWKWRQKTFKKKLPSPKARIGKK